MSPSSGGPGTPDDGVSQVTSYDEAFYAHIRDGAARSAAAVSALLYPHLRPRSILDVGCGDGTWLLAWSALGVADFAGVDGVHLERGPLRIEADRFRAADLSQPLRLERRFDLVQSLEVAEHLPASAADDFVASLTRHSDLVLFSAAPPGQIGNHHLNEQPYEYWRRRFAAAGYDCYDFVRPALARAAEVEPWYRYNMFLYVQRRAAAALPQAIAATRVPGEVTLRDSAPVAWRLRKTILSALPRWGATAISQMSAHCSSALRRLSRNTR